MIATLSMSDVTATYVLCTITTKIVISRNIFKNSGCLDDCLNDFTCTRHHDRLMMVLKRVVCLVKPGLLSLIVLPYRLVDLLLLVAHTIVLQGTQVQLTISQAVGR